MDYAYYPGCSLHSTAREYDDSVRQVFAALGVGLHELEDWNCCGASSAHMLDRGLSLALPARNLAIAQRLGLGDLVMPCAACFNRHKTADYELRTDPGQRAFLEEAAGFRFSGQVAVRPLLDVVARDIGLERLRSLVKKPLAGLQAVAYYGCLLVRPAQVTGFENPEAPEVMERLLAALGATACSWAYGTECCGGGLSLTKPGVAARLVDRLVQRAREAGAQAMVTSCPLCQVNLEMRQGKSGPQMPVFYFTELIGLALGIEEARSWWSKHLINPVKLLSGLDL